MFCNSINLGIQNFERERQKDESINIFKRPTRPMSKIREKWDRCPIIEIIIITGIIVIVNPNNKC